MNKKMKLVQSIWQYMQDVIEMDSDDSDKDDVVLWLADLGERATRIPIKRRPKRQWVKEWRKAKKSRGSFAFLTKELQVHDENGYRNYLRLSQTEFDYLLSLVASDVQRANTDFREAIPADEKLAICLRFLATGESYQSLNYQSRVSTASICRIVPEVCKALYNGLKSTYLKFPSSPLEWELISKEFAMRWQFPNCLGALDGKHITFRPPKKDGAYYYNYKGTGSIVLLALVDANNKFIFVDVGCNGRCNDAGVFLQSKLSGILEEETNLPENSEIGRGRSLPYVVVADDAFPLQKHLMKPYPYHTPCPQKQVFNKRLSRARQNVERAFGILSNRFRVFLSPMSVKVETVQAITLACCALHNYLAEVGEVVPENAGTSTASNFHPSSNIPYNPRKGEAENIRQEFVKYFNEEGKIDWGSFNEFNN